MTTSLPVIHGVFLSEHIRTAKSPISFGSANLEYVSLPSFPAQAHSLIFQTQRLKREVEDMLKNRDNTYLSMGVISVHFLAYALDFSSVLEVVMSVATYLLVSLSCNFWVTWFSD